MTKIPHHPGKAWKNFLNGISNSIASRKDYCGAMEHFIKYSKKVKPEDLLKGPTRQIEDRIISYVVWQKERGLSTSIMRQRISAVKLFYEMNRKALSWKIITKAIGRHAVKKDRSYRHAELQKMVKIAIPRDSSIVSTGTSGGIRREGLAGLKVGDRLKIDLTPFGFKGLYIYRTIVYRGDTEEYVTFCTPEAAIAQDIYLGIREQCGEVITEASPLFREQFNKRIKEKVRKAIPLQASGLGTAIDQLAVDAGVKQRVKCIMQNGGSRIRHEVKIVHGFKKFFITQCSKARVNPTYIAYMAGHLRGKKDIKVTELDMVYDKPEESDLLKEYVKAIPYLTIDDRYRLELEVAEKDKELEANELQRLRDSQHMAENIQAAVVEYFDKLDPDTIKQMLKARLKSA